MIKNTLIPLEIEPNSLPYNTYELYSRCEISHLVSRFILIVYHTTEVRTAVW